MTKRTRKPLPQNDQTRSQLLALLRTGTWTVDDLAAQLGVTDNAVRFHLTALEAGQAVERRGVRKLIGAGQPAVMFGLTPAAEEAFSRAYAPVLAATVVELHETMPRPQLLSFLKRVGKRLAGARGRAAGPLVHRVATASQLLNDLGGITVVEKTGKGYSIVGKACPLASAVMADNCVCAAVTSLVAEVVDTDVRERCDRSGRPQCCFEISAQPGE